MNTYTFSFIIPDTTSTRIVTTQGNNVNEGRKAFRAILQAEDILWLLEPIELIEPSIMLLVNRPISDLNLSVRVHNCIASLGITTIGELVGKHSDDILIECKNFGVKSLNEVREKLCDLGLKLK